MEIAREEAQAKKSGDDSGAGKKACSEFLKGYAFWAGCVKLYDSHRRVPDCIAQSSLLSV